MRFCTAANYSVLGFCKPHVRVVLAIGPSLRLAASASWCLSRLFPCDAKAVLNMFPQLFQPVAPLPLLIILAMLKEPTAMKKWLEIWNESLADAAASAQGIQGSELAAALERLGRLMSKRQCPHELSSLSTTGRSATFLGVLGTLQGFGILAASAKPPPGEPLEDWVHLGHGSQKIVTNSDVAIKFCKAFQYDIAVVTSVEDLERLSETLELLRQKANIPELKLGGDYVWAHVVRKVVMGAIAAASSQGDGSAFDWYSVSKGLLLKLVPDENEALKAFPDDYTVGEIGEMVFGDPEQGFYASCWGCLFSAPVEAWPSLIKEMHELFESKVKFQLAWEAVNGDIVAPTPLNLVSKQSPFKSTKRVKPTPQDSENSRCPNAGLANAGLAAPAAPTRSAIAASCSNAGLPAPAAPTRDATKTGRVKKKVSATKAARRGGRKAGKAVKR